MMTMQNMELTDDEKIDTVLPIPMESRSEYPYGLRICLTNAELEKLGIDGAEAGIGSFFHLHGMARITSVSCEDRGDGPCYRIEAQIEYMSVESEEAENEDVEASEPSPRRKLYAV